MRFSNVAGVLLLGTAALITLAYLRPPGPSQPAMPASAPVQTAGGLVLEENQFAPAEDLERLDLERLEKARRSVDVAMYAFTDRYLAEELAKLARRGVAVRVYRDREQFDDEERAAGERGYESSTAILRGVPNVAIRVKPSGRHDLMHLKAYVIDGELLRDGSANWSNAGLKLQDNNARYTTDPAEIRAFQLAFGEMWARPGNSEVR